MPAGDADATPSNPADILELAYEAAINRLEKSFVVGAGLTDDVEFVCRCSNLAGTRFLLACLVAKLSNPTLDIRKPYTEIGGAGIYSGRHYDETYVAPFAFKYKLPVNATTSFLTPAFRTNKAVIAPGVELVGRPKLLYGKVVKLITAVYEGKIDAELMLIEVIRWLIVVREEREQRRESLVAALQAVQTELSVPAESIVNLLQQHLALPKAARLPVLVVAAAYQAAQTYLGEKALPLQAHNAADSQTGALGDIQIALKDESDVVTVYEMKAKRVTHEDIEIALQKLAATAYSIDNYIFITTELIDEAVKDFAATIHGKTGVNLPSSTAGGF